MRNFLFILILFLALSPTALCSKGWMKNAKGFIKRIVKNPGKILSSPFAKMTAPLLEFSPSGFVVSFAANTLDMVKKYGDCHIEIQNNMSTTSLVDPVYQLHNGILKENPKYSISPGQNGTIVFKGGRVIPSGTNGTLAYRIKGTDLYLVVSWSVPVFWKISSKTKYGLKIYEDPSQEAIKSTPMRPAEGKYLTVKNKNIVVHGIMTGSGVPRINIIVTKTTNLYLLGIFPHIILMIVIMILAVMYFVAYRNKCHSSPRPFEIPTTYTK